MEESNFLNLSALDRYLVVMSPEEIRDFELALIGGMSFEISGDRMFEWSIALDEKNRRIQDRFVEAFRLASIKNS